MREIKFMVWDEKTKWLDDDFYIRSNGSTYDMARYTYDTPNIEIEPTNFTELFQFTGLKDRTGKEIYEGHILDTKGKHESDFGLYCKRVVKWNEWFSQWEGIPDRDVNSAFNEKYVEIIGHIKTHPELLEPKQ